MAQLIKYEFKLTRFFGDGDYEHIYELTILKRKWFRMHEIKVNYTIDMFQSVKQYHDHWDNLIKTKQKL